MYTHPDVFRKKRIFQKLGAGNVNTGKITYSMKVE